MIFVEYVGVNMDFQVPLLIIDSDHMSTHSRTRRVTHLTLIDARVVSGFMEIVSESFGIVPRRGLTIY
jgi:hypothetical protein